MTAKEQAKDLIRKYWVEINNIAENSISWRQGKKSALILVDYIIKEWEILKNEDCSISLVKQKVLYWQEVKKEIEKL